MSVINQVLRDLQQQEPQLRLVEPEALRGSARQDSGRRRPAVWIGFAALLAIGGVLLALYAPERDTATADSTPNPKVAPFSGVIEGKESLVATSVDPAKDEESAISRLQGLQLDRGPRSLSLRFELSAATTSYLQRQSGNEYRFVLRNSQSEVETPALGVNPWIRHLELQPRDGNLLVALETEPRVSVETSTQPRPAGGQNWILSLQAPTEPEPATAAVETGIEVETEADTTETMTAAGKAIDPPQAAAEPAPATGAQEKAATTATATSTGPEHPVAEDDAPPKLDIRASAARSAPSPALERRRRAHALFRAGDYAGLVRRFAEDPRQDDLLALAWQRLGQYQQAVASYRRLLQREPAEARHWVGLGLSLEQLQRPAEALSAYDRARALGGLSNRLEVFVAERLRLLGSATEPGGQ